MINRNNYVLVVGYLDYKLTVQQVTVATESGERDRLRHLLVWLDEKPLEQAHLIKPTFPAFLEGLAPGGKRFGAAHLAAVHKTVRQFIRWAKMEHPLVMRPLNETWIESLRPSRGRSEVAELRERALYTVDEVRALVQVEGRTLAERRVIAGVALLFLSGMRIGAFLTLPIDCVDLVGMKVHQLPEHGVHTKNSKAAITPLLAIDDLVAVCKKWDDFVRAELPGSAYWFVHLSRFGMFGKDAPKSKNRELLQRNFTRDLRTLCERAGVVYKSAHKLRHGFAVHALKNARNLADLKAISQALMHSNVGITDGIYARLADDDVQRVVSGLGKTAQAAPVEAMGMEEMMERVVRKVLAER